LNRSPDQNDVINPSSLDCDIRCRAWRSLSATPSNMWLSSWSSTSF
jgi:hypothetical protein